MTFKTEYEGEDGEAGEKAKRGEGELMEESFGSAGNSPMVEAPLP